MAISDVALLERKFYVCLEDREGILFSAPAAALVDRDDMKRCLEKYASCIRASGLHPAATFFCAWIGYVALAQQYMLSAENKKIDLSLSNIDVQLYGKGQRFAFAFKIRRWSEQALPASGADRRAARHRALAELYGETIRPLFESMAAAADIRTGQLWGQLPARFEYYRKILLSELPEAGLKTRMTEDYDALLHEVEPAVFGEKKNPFGVKFHWVEDPREAGKQIPLKSACCLYYKTEGGEYCYTCPRMKETERAERRRKLREKTEASSP